MDPNTKFALIVSIPPTITALAGLIVALRTHSVALTTKDTTGEIHKDINSRLDQWKDETKKSSFAAGKVAEQSEAAARDTSFAAGVKSETDKKP